MRFRGETVAELKIGADGRVTEARIIGSSGRNDLDQSALGGMRRCVYRSVVNAGLAPTDWLQAQYLWRGGPATGAERQAELEQTQRNAEAGDALAQSRLGAWYMYGTYIARDFEKAAHWLRQAAEAGQVDAQLNLGLLYERGQGVPRDWRLAARWYARAAGQGNGWAQGNLGWLYMVGIDGKPDFEEARHWLTRSAEGGLASGQVKLGLLISKLARNDEERAAAVPWYMLAAEQDDPNAHYWVGRSFELGIGNPQDDARAAEHYRAALGRTSGWAEAALAKLVKAGRVAADAGAKAPR